MLHAADTVLTGSTAGVLVEIGALLLGLGVLGRVAGRFGIPPIPVYLLVGLVLGQAGDGPLTFDADVVRLGSDIGLVLLLFLLGLDYAGRELASHLRAQARGGVIDAALNLTPGVAIGLLLGWDVRAAIVLGGVTYISSSGVVAKLVSDLGRSAAPETPVVLSLLVLEDLVMVGYLPLVAVLVSGEDLPGALVMLATAAAAATAALAFAVRHGHRLTPALSPRSEEAFLLTTFGLVLLVAGLAEQVHLSAAVGAFLLGIALSGPVVDRARDAITPLRDLFAAAFFAFFGLEVDLGAVGSAWIAVAALVAIGVASKLATGWLVARGAGVGPTGARHAGLSLIARGEFSIVLAGLAVAAGVEPQLGAVAAVYVLATALLGTLGVALAARPYR